MAVWVVLIISVSGAAKVVGSSFTSSRELPDTESSKVQEILSKEFPSQRGDSIQLVIESQSQLTSAENRRTVEELIAEVAKSPISDSIDSPYDPRFAALSNDQRIAFATVHLNGSAGELPDEEVK